MSIEVNQQNDTLLGYTLTKKIGSGGYGDVWEAEAPGGLKKAVKIIHGFHDEKRAQAELKALDRIKEARHPFILSLERIEISHSKLIVVSELAEQSLANLVDKNIQAHGSGIARDELLGYMRDAADALDYLYDTFGLQHLDVKPENILIVAGHAKVADFGLVKDISEVSQSLMSGMTPTYAAPEMFDGRPGTNSDQYSLAIVYQEMLTTARPFSGTTPAQLAAQHINGKPDVRLLPIGDQAVVAKALSKNPQDRYKNCKQFVEQLSNRKTRKRVIAGRTKVRQTMDSGSETVVFQSNHSQQNTELFSDSHLTFNSVEFQSFDPPVCDPTDTEFQPTLIVGLGKSASLVAKKVKDRMVARHGDAALLPSLGLLCIDSDRDALAKLSISTEASAIDVNQTLAIPLRRSDQYRQKTKLDLSWISRRWIYNVPRSLQTEGLRPLGRLALVDHFDSICDKIGSSLEEIVKPENIARTCETFELNPPQAIAPKVIVIANIAGGIGSGMANDLAYTIRLLLAEQGVKASTLNGLLMYGHEAGRELGLANANAFAYLSELRHFAEGGYPGDERLEIPEFEDELPFDHSYVLPLSGGQSRSFSDLDQIAEYVCLSATTKCSVFFDANRKAEKQRDEFGFRSFGISVCGPGLQTHGQQAVEKMSRGLINYWLEHPSDDFCQSTFIQNINAEYPLTLENSVKDLSALIIESAEWKRSQSLTEQLIEHHSTGKTLPDFAIIEQHFDDLMDAPGWRNDTLSTNSELIQAMENEINVEGHRIGDALSLHLLKSLNERQISFDRIHKKQNAIDSLVAQLQEKTTAQLDATRTRLQDLREEYEQKAIKKGRFRPGAILRDFIVAYGNARFEDFVLRCCNDHYRIIKNCLHSSKEILNKFQMQLQAVGNKFEVHDLPRRSAKYKPTFQQMLVDSVEENWFSHIQQIETSVLSQIQAGNLNFLDILSDTLDWQQQLPTMIKDAAQSVLANAFKSISVDSVISKNNIQPVAIKSWLNELLGEAKPFVTDCGGGATLLVGQPSKANPSMISQLISESFGLNAKEIRGTTGDLVLCLEAEQIPLANLAFSILKDSPETVEIAKRIHSRDDVHWTSLDDLI